MVKKINKKIDKLFDKYILDQVNKKFPVYRIHKYSNEYCLKMFKCMLIDVTRWVSLTKLSDYKGETEYHYKYLNSVFNKWASKDIFSDAYKQLLQNEYLKLKHIKNNKTINLFIDSTFITNLYGINSIAVNPEYRKKKYSKISIVSDENKVIIAVKYDETHLTDTNKPAFKHDVKLVQSTLNNMNIKLPKDKIVKLGGDKGYICRRRFKLNNGKRIKLIATKRHNQAIQNTEREKKVLKKRLSVEMALASIKKYNRILVRKDKNIRNYMGFLFMGLIDIIDKK